MENLYSNYRGTMINEFRIGKNGSTVFTRPTAPSNTLGKDGDYCAVMDEPSLLCKVEGQWIDFNSYNIIEINSDTSTIVKTPKTLFLIDTTNNPVTLTLTELPKSGSDLVIHDINENSSVNNIIVNIEDGMTTVYTNTLNIDGSNVHLLTTSNSVIEI